MLHPSQRRKQGTLPRFFSAIDPPLQSHVHALTFLQDVLNEIERNLIDAMAVARNVVRNHSPLKIAHCNIVIMSSTPNSSLAAVRPK